MKKIKVCLCVCLFVSRSKEKGKNNTKIYRSRRRVHRRVIGVGLSNGMFSFSNLDERNFSTVNRPFGRMDDFLRRFDL
jgi:hypothetical protein